MAFYERDYIEIRGKNYKMQITGITRKGINKDEIVEYLLGKKKSAKKAMIFYSILSIMGLIIILSPLISDDPTMIIPLGIFFTAPTIILAICACKERKKLINCIPEDEGQQYRIAPEALDQKLKNAYKLNDDHDMVSVDSALKGNPEYIGSWKGSAPNGAAKYYRDTLNKELTLYAAAHVQSQLNDLKNAAKVNAGNNASASVVDLRSDAEKNIERSANKALSQEREELAQEMFEYLKTHDTGNNMAHYREFRDRFHERSEAIAEGGGYHQALLEIYYRIKQLCSEQGVYFHSGAVDHVFDGGYWQS